MTGAEAMNDCWADGLKMVNQPSQWVAHQVLQQRYMQTLKTPCSQMF